LVSVEGIVVEVACPLCAKSFGDDVSYAGHLGEAHGLVDDDGAETTVERALIVSGVAGDRELAEVAAEEAAAAKAIVQGPVTTTVDASRIYDPRQDDPRLKPIVLGLAGLLLLVAIGIGLALAL
jgi:hypothetical protein